MQKVVATLILITVIVLVALGFNHFMQGVGFMSAGYLFGLTRH